MTQTKKPIWKDFKKLDIQIRTIEHQDFTEEKERDYYLVEVGLYESLGEQGDILTLDYENNPTEEEIIKDTKEHLKETLKDYSNKILSYREEQHLKILKKVIEAI